jgi:hypothetical protein
MRTKKYTFETPVELPVPAVNQGAGFVDVVPDGELFSLAMRRIDEYPVIVQRSTGKRGHLVSAVTNQILNLSQFGKTTVVVQEFIVVTGSKPTHYDNWDDEDWHVEQ